MRNWPAIYPRRTRNDWCVDCGKMGGTKRVVYIKATREEAEAKAQECRNLRAKLGQAAKSLSTDQLLDATAALTLLEGRYSLQEAVRGWLGMQTASGAGKTVQAVFDALRDEYEARLARKEIREASYTSTMAHIKPFLTLYGTRRIGSVTRQEIEGFANGYQNGTTRAGMLRYVRLLFSYAVHHEWLTANPALKVRLPKVQYAAPKYCSAEQVEALFKAAESFNPDLIPVMALGFFAGLRPAECDRIEQADIMGVAGVIRVRPEVSKRAEHPRTVPITPQLSCLLRRPIVVQGVPFHSQFNALCRHAGVKVGRDAARHSFATHRLAQTGNPEVVAHELGHVSGSWRILFKHYAATGCSKEDAELYFNIGKTE